MAHYIGIAKQINEIKYFVLFCFWFFCFFFLRKKFYHDVKMASNKTRSQQRRKFTFQTTL